MACEIFGGILQLLFIEQGNTEGKENETRDCRNGDGCEIRFRFRNTVDQRISVGKVCGQIFACFWYHSDQIGEKDDTARSDENARIGACGTREKDRERNDPESEEPPAENGKHQVFRDSVIPEIRVIGVSNTEAEPIAECPENSQHRRFGYDDLMALQPLRQGKDERARGVFLCENIALKQNKGDQCHGDIFEKLYPRIHRADRDVSDGHAAFGEGIRHHFE